jgi:hypothetical protein
VVCSVWREPAWRLAGTRVREGEAETAWEWDAGGAESADATPVFGASERDIAFLRTQGEASDVWLLSLNEDQKPVAERRLTELGNVSRVVMWSEDAGLLIETPLRLDGTVVPVVARVDVEAGPRQPPVVVASPLPTGLLAEYVPARQEFVVEAFRLGFDERNQLVTFGKDKEVRSLQAEGYWPRVAPDGRRIVFTRPRQ